MQERDPLILWNPGHTSLEVHNRGTSDPTKRTPVLQKLNLSRSEEFHQVARTPCIHLAALAWAFSPHIHHMRPFSPCVGILTLCPPCAGKVGILISCPPCVDARWLWGCVCQVVPSSTQSHLMWPFSLYIHLVWLLLPHMGILTSCSPHMIILTLHGHSHLVWMRGDFGAVYKEKFLQMFIICTLDIIEVTSNLSSCSHHTSIWDNFRVAILHRCEVTLGTGAHVKLSPPPHKVTSCLSMRHTWDGFGGCAHRVVPSTTQSHLMWHKVTSHEEPTSCASL